ncbi:MAG TPA: acyl-CoA thioesterase [Fibrobacteres bacterium]|jgi:acyl-CoA hydrolase|nr:acyl-CoA thioesterase [Fibrobacterota bacterium]
MNTASVTTVAQSRVESSEIIQQADLNSMGHLFGGRLVSIIDKIAAISAMKHVRGPVVTLSIDNLVFRKPVRISSILTIKASVNRVFKHSLEVGVIVTSLSYGNKEEEHVCSAYLTFVALDMNGKTVEVAPVAPETADEKRRFEQAGIRRDHRLALQAQLGKH